MFSGLVGIFFGDFHMFSGLDHGFIAGFNLAGTALGMPGPHSGFIFSKGLKTREVRPTSISFAKKTPGFLRFHSPIFELESIFSFAPLLK